MATCQEPDIYYKYIFTVFYIWLLTSEYSE